MKRIKTFSVVKKQFSGYNSNDDKIGGMNLYRIGINSLVTDAVATE